MRGPGMRGPGMRGPGMRGPMGMGRGGEKARDFKGTMIKLIRYLGAYKLAIGIIMMYQAR